MAALSTARIEERDGRVVDFLDDKLQNLDDLDHLDALLHTVRSQQVLLRKQVCCCIHPEGSTHLTIHPAPRCRSRQSVGCEGFAGASSVHQGPG